MNKCLFHLRSAYRSLSGKAMWMAVLLLVFADNAFATEAGGAMPWEGPLQQIMDSISGPVAKILGVIVIVMSGLAIAFGEAGSGVRKLLQVVFGLSIAFTASSIVMGLFHQSGGVVF